MKTILSSPIHAVGTNLLANAKKESSHHGKLCGDLPEEASSSSASSSSLFSLKEDDRQRYSHGCCSSSDNSNDANANVHEDNDESAQRLDLLAGFLGANPALQRAVLERQRQRQKNMSVSAAVDQPTRSSSRHATRIAAGVLMTKAASQRDLLGTRAHSSNTDTSDSRPFLQKAISSRDGMTSNSGSTSASRERPSIKKATSNRKVLGATTRGDRLLARASSSRGIPVEEKPTGADISVDEKPTEAEADPEEQDQSEKSKLQSTPEETPTAGREATNTSSSRRGSGCKRHIMMKRAASSKGFSSTTRSMGQRASSQRCLKATSLLQIADNQAEEPAVHCDDASPRIQGPSTSAEAMTENDNDNRNVDTASADANADNNDSISNSNSNDVKRECRIHKRRIKRSTTDPSDQRSITSTSRDSQRSGRSFRTIRSNSTSSDDDAAGPSASSASHRVSRRARGNIDEDQSDQPATTKKRISNNRVRRIQEKSTTSSGIAVAQRRQRRPLT